MSHVYYHGAKHSGCCCGGLCMGILIVGVSVPLLIASGISHITTISADDNVPEVTQMVTNERSEILFRDIPWGSKKETIKGTLNDGDFYDNGSKFYGYRTGYVLDYDVNDMIEH